MRGRLQRTIRHCIETSGIGFLTGRDIAIRFLPADENHGVVFRRVDCAGKPSIPARIEFTAPRQRRTAIERDGVAVEMIEHVMAALAGLQIDNCVVELNGPEPPGFDGSAESMTKLLLSAGTTEQSAPREAVVISSTVFVADPNDDSEITYQPASGAGLTIFYRLDYGLRSPIPRQELSVEIDPATFVRELAFARTFVLEKEAEALRAQGYGSRTTTRDLLVIGPNGPIDNAFRVADECARHKILDCLGDFALLGCDVRGEFSAYRSGHHLNREMVRRLVARAAETETRRHGRAA